MSELCQLCDIKTSNNATACCAKILCRTCKYMCDCDGAATTNWNKLNPKKVEAAAAYYKAHINRDQILSESAAVAAGLNYSGGIPPMEPIGIRRLP